MPPSGGQVPTSLQVYLEVRPVAINKIFKIFSQGDYVNTENKLDIAIEGKDFFKVFSNGLEYYTQAGSLKVDKDGFVTTLDGNRVQQEFNVPITTLSTFIDSNGKIACYGPDNKTVASV